MQIQSLGGAKPLPNLLLDAIEFGFFLQLRHGGNDAVSTFRHALHRQGLLEPGDDPRRIRLLVPVDGIGDDALNVELLVAPFGADGLVIKNVSSVVINPLRLLRRRLGEAACGPRGLDRNDNVVGPTSGRAPQLLAAQLELVGSAVDRLAAAIDAAVPPEAELVKEEFWLRSAEACLDLPAGDAPRLVRSLQRAALAGTIWTAIDNYPAHLHRSRAEDVAGLLVLHWWRTMKGPGFKAYAKRRDIVRAEVACTSRDAIAGLTGRQVTYIDGDKAVGLLLGFVEAAAPLLEELVDHIIRAGDRSRSVADLFVALGLLSDLASGRGLGRGRPPSPEAMAAAVEAFDALFTLGSFRAFNLRRGCAVRRCLDALSGPAGPLARDGRQAIYVLRPEFAAAASAIGDWDLAA